MTLEELIKKYKQNSKLSSDDSKEYRTLLYHRFDEGNYDETTINNLMDGPGEDAMWTIAHYTIFPKKNNENSYDKFITSKRFSTNKKGLSSTKLVYLLKAFLKLSADNNDNNYTEKINLYTKKTLVKLCRMSKNDKKYNKNTLKLFNSTIISDDNNRKILLKLDLSDMSNDWRAIKDFFQYFIIESGFCSNENMRLLYMWLKESGNDMQYFPLPEKKSEENSIQDCLTEKDESNKTETVTLKQILLGMMQMISTQANIISTHDHKISNLCSQLQHLTDMNKSLNLQLEESRKNVAYTNNLLIEKNKENDELKQNIEELQKENRKLTNEINETKQFSNTVVLNRKNQSDAANKKLSSALSLDYQDFMDAKGMDMTIELGENMRAQLDSVFSILKKNGINIK